MSRCPERLPDGAIMPAGRPLGGAGAPASRRPGQWRG